MKPFLKYLVLFLFVGTTALVVPQKVKAQVSLDYQIFYDDLSPYGTWVNTADYGYVWMPNVASGFIPYNTNGYWIFTDEGWAWVSNYAWGWAPFHYGRWYNDPEYGPMWIPGNEWGPGWVTWRQTADYYGWAPIGPGIGIDIAYSNSYNVPYSQWTFVRNRNFGRRDMNRYYINRSRNTTIIKNSTVINNIREGRGNNARYNGGPNRIDVQKHTGITVTPVIVKETSKPGLRLAKSELQVYKPRIAQNNNTGQRPAPAKVKELKDVAPMKNRNGGNRIQQQPGNAKTIPQQKQQPFPDKQPLPNQQPQRQQLPPQHQQPQRQQPLPNKQPQPNRRQPMPPQRQQPQHQQPQRQQPLPNKQPLPNRQQPMPPQRQQPQHQQPQRQQPLPNKQPQPNRQPERQQPQPPKQQPAKEHGNDPRKEIA